jgi:hypothetical protein
MFVMWRTVYMTCIFFCALDCAFPRGGHVAYILELVFRMILRDILGLDILRIHVADLLEGMSL